MRTTPATACSRIGRWFRAEKLNPWPYHYWQHILGPQAFLERARPVLRLYEQAGDLLRQGIWVICEDEKTSLQARRGEQSPRAAQSGQPMRVSARYKRQGALQLFAGLSVADGYGYGQTAERKRFVDFQAFLQQTLLPEALWRKVRTLYLILDNGRTPTPQATGDLASRTSSAPRLAVRNLRLLAADQFFVVGSDRNLV